MFETLETLLPNLRRLRCQYLAFKIFLVHGSQQMERLESATLQDYIEIDEDGDFFVGFLPLLLGALRERRFPALRRIVFMGVTYNEGRASFVEGGLRSSGLEALCLDAGIALEYPEHSWGFTDSD